MTAFAMLGSVDLECAEFLRRQLSFEEMDPTRRKTLTNDVPMNPTAPMTNVVTAVVPVKWSV